MKKIKLFVILIFINTTIHAIPFPGSFQLGIIPVGIGLTFSENNDINFDLDVRFLYISYEIYFLNLINDSFINTGLGFTWVPINYRFLLNNHYWSFVNFQVFWNIFALIPNRDQYGRSGASNVDMAVHGAIFGPFVYINYAPNFNRNHYILTYGLRYNLTGKFDTSTRLFLFNIEGGYRIINTRRNNRKDIYFSIGVDIFWTSFVISSNRARRNNRNN